MKALKISGAALGVLFVLLTGLYVSGLGGNLAMMAFVAFNSPPGEFNPEAAAPAPDYADRASWAALPGVSSPAQLTPAGVTPSRGDQPVDVFFIHPTGFLSSLSWTSPLDVDSATEENTRWMMANQASAFNGCCNVFAPRYREMTIFAYFGEQSVRDRILNFSYQDVLRAFEQFLEHRNDGRPFIIASHSQGSHHAMRLLAEVVDSSALRERMIAAYLIGSIILPVSPAWFESMDHIGPCEAADDLGCVVHWDTMPEGSPPLERPEPSLCTNPLSWSVDETKADAALNEGAVVPVGRFNAELGSDDAPSGQQFDALDAPLVGHTWARCESGSLFVGNQDGTGFEEMGSGNLGSYHGLDYALFYMNIRSNALRRVAAYLQQH